MQGSFLSYAAMAAIVAFSSCEKKTVGPNPLSSIVVTTAVIGGGNVKLNTNVRDSAKAYNARVFALKAGNSDILLYPTSNPAKPYYTSTQETENGGIYSIFLTGQSPAVEGLFLKESIPPIYSDSTVGIRVINLSPNSTPVNISLASDTKTNIFAGVGYKQVTAFMRLPVKLVIPTGSLTFQVRDGVTNNLLVTYALPTSANSNYPGISTTLSRNKNLTLVIRGLMGTTGADGFGIFPVAYY